MRQFYLWSLLLTSLVTGAYAQPKLVYNNTKFQKATEWRWLDTGDALLPGLLKNKRTIQVLDLTTSAIKHEFDLASKGLKKAEFSDASFDDNTLYLYDKKLLVVYNYATNTALWTFNEAPVESIFIGSETVRLSVKPKAKADPNYLVLDKSSGKVLDRQTRDDKADKWSEVGGVGDVRLEMKDKSALASVLVGKISLRVINKNSKSVLAEHEISGMASFYRVFPDAGRNQIVLALPESWGKTMNMKERGATFQFIAFDAATGSLKWKYSSTTRVDFHLYEYVSQFFYFTPSYYQTGDGLLFAGINDVEFVDFATGKRRWQAPVFTSDQDGLLAPRLFGFTAFLVNGPAGTVTFADLTDAKKPALLVRSLADGTVKSKTDLDKKTEVVPFIFPDEGNSTWVQENGVIDSEKPKAITTKLYKPVSIARYDANGQRIWRTTMKDEVLVSGPVGKDGYAATKAAIIKMDGPTGKPFKAVAHKIKFDEYQEFHPMPAFNGVLVWGSNGFSFVRF